MNNGQTRDSVCRQAGGTPARPRRGVPGGYGWRPLLFALLLVVASPGPLQPWGPLLRDSLGGSTGLVWAQEPDGASPVEPPAEETTLLLVLGAGGTDEYQRQFEQWADRWKAVAGEGGARYVELGREPPGDTSDRERLASRLQTEPRNSTAPLWLVLIGHGTFYRDTARFNLRGPDFTAAELAQWLEPFQRPLIVINCASSSGPFLNRLAAANRTVITATRSGSEQNFARFGQYLSEAWSNPAADLDHDDQVSLLEAYLLASAQVQRFYDSESRLATEHALLDDNGDGLGTPSEFFRGARAVKAAKDGASLDGQFARRQLLRAASRDGLTTDQRAERDRLEAEIERLREQKPQLPEDEYYRQLEALLLPLAQIYTDQ